MSILNKDDCILLIIDVQEKLLNAVFNKITLEKNAQILAKASDILEIPVIVTEQYPKGLGSTVESIKNSLSANTQYFEKNTFSALDNELILQELQSKNKCQVVVFGIETHICVSQTVNSLKNLGYEVTLIKDASGSRCESEHKAGIERIKSNGADVITTEIALFEWLRTSSHPNFKQIQSLIK